MGGLGKGEQCAWVADWNEFEMGEGAAVGLLVSHSVGRTFGSEMVVVVGAGVRDLQLLRTAWVVGSGM